MKRPFSTTGLVLAVGMACGASGARAQAITYTSNSSFDGASVNLSITTDGVIGALSKGDILSWNIAIVDSAGTIDLTPSTSQDFLSGGLNASASGLFFDFSSANALLFEASRLGDNGPLWCATGNDPCFNGTDLSSIGVTTQYGGSPLEVVAENGVTEIAMTTVPEPASLAVLLFGLMAVGVARRPRPII